jgi:hypothetical protein
LVSFPGLIEETEALTVWISLLNYHYYLKKETPNFILTSIFNYNWTKTKPITNKFQSLILIILRSDSRIPIPFQSILGTETAMFRFEQEKIRKRIWFSISISTSFVSVFQFSSCFHGGSSLCDASGRTT